MCVRSVYELSVYELSVYLLSVCGLSICARALCANVCVCASGAGLKNKFSFCSVSIMFLIICHYRRLCKYSSLLFCDDYINRRSGGSPRGKRDTKRGIGLRWSLRGAAQNQFSQFDTCLEVDSIWDRHPAK